MTEPDLTAVLERLVDALDGDTADRLGRRLQGTAAVPTIAQHIPAARDSATEACRRTYGPGWRRLEAALGDKPLDEVTTQDLKDLRDQIHREVGEDVVAKAIKSGKPLLSYEPRAHGYGAAENFVRAVRNLYNHALDANVTTANPASMLKAPKRPDAPERPLTGEELAEVATVWCTTGNDTELDSLLYEFHRKTAARRIGGLNLRLANLDPREGAIWSTEKFSKVRKQPLDVEFIDRLDRFARSRGATAASDHVFRMRSGKPITYKRYEVIYGRLHRYTTWTRQLEVGVHWIRHTTLDDV